MKRLKMANGKKHPELFMNMNLEEPPKKKQKLK